MIISVDTEKMNSMASLAQRINAEIDLCITALLPVVQHSDWNCRERDEINDGIATIRKNATVLQENIDTFSSRLKYVASLFDEYEASLPNQYQQISTLLGNSFSAPCAGTTVASGAVTAGVSAAMAENVRVSGGLENNALGNLTNPIQLCKFEEVDFSALY